MLGSTHMDAQSNDPEAATSRRFFVGLAYGISFAIGDFGNTDVTNAEAGYAQNGRRYDLYSGYSLNDRLTLTAGLRYQRFQTDVGDVVRFFDDLNPGISFGGENGDWQTYYLLFGAAYSVPIVKRFEIYPRFAVGPLWTVSPGFDVQATTGFSQNEFTRSSETGLGLGYDLGVGLRTNLGNRLALLPTFTFSGGRVNLSDVKTSLNTVTLTRDFTSRIQSFNLGLSLAYIL